MVQFIIFIFIIVELIKESFSYVTSLEKLLHIYHYKEMKNIQNINTQTLDLQYNTINNLCCTEYLTKLSLRGALQV